MSIRIHELAKRYNMEGKDLLALLKERGYVAADTKSVSSTVSKIYQEEIEKELGSRVTATKAESTNGTAAIAEGPAVTTAELPSGAEPAVSAGVAPESSRVRLPEGVRVKSADDIVREREVAAAAKVAAQAATTSAASPAPAPAPAPPASAPVRAPAAAPAPVSRPPVLPPRIPAAPVSSAPKTPPLPTSAPARPPASSNFGSGVPSSPSSSPRPGSGAAGGVGVRPAAAAAPAASVRPPVSSVPAAAPARPAAAASAPAPSPAAEGKAPTAPPPLPVSSPKPPPARPMPPPAPTTPVSTVTIQGDVKIIHFKPPVVVRDFATALGLRPFQLISELMQMGIFASITQSLDENVAAKVAEKHGFLLEVKHRGDPAVQQAQKDKAKVPKPPEDEAANLAPRPPVVVILGHVDHGKTSLLDAIRKADVASGEAGGITQHIGAYQIEHNGRKITFLDTPGHAAFNKMRARGASVTDIAVLVVAADDGFMPQTDEALQHAQNAKVTLIVAVNKMDVKGANLDQVKAQMQQRGIAPEDWGGEVPAIPVSAIKGTGINELLEDILLRADVMELRANPKADAAGVVIESQVDVGRGPLATVIVQRGTLRVGDSLVSGAYWAKVRAMFDDQGKPLKEAPPSTPVRVIGWSGTPESGAQVRVVKNAREAENLAEEEQQNQRSAVAAAGPKEVSVERLFANIAATQARVLKVIVKTDVFGSAEAVRHVLEGIKSTKVSLEIVSTDVGLVTKNDVLMASASGATILGFNTKLENGVTPLAKHHGVRIETFGIIYELGDRVREMLADMLEPDLKEIKLGAAEVRVVFPLAKGFVGGCLVTEGKITRGATSRLRRGRESVYEGKVATLKRFKDDANEVRAGLECGIKLDDFNGYQVGDLIECFEVQKVRASL